MIKRQCIMLATPSDDGHCWPNHVRPKRLLTRIKLVTLDGLLILIYVLRGITVRNTSYKDMSATCACAKRRGNFGNLARHNYIDLRDFPCVTTLQKDGHKYFFILFRHYNSTPEYNSYAPDLAMAT
jgi:hypothetical protein